MKLIVHEIGITLNLTVDELAECLGYASRSEMEEYYRGYGPQVIAQAIRDTWKLDVELTIQ